MVVAFYSPNHPNVVAVKRVVAVEGDVVVTKAPYPFEREEVPAGHVWVEGDVEERGKSFDSNYYGPVSLGSSCCVRVETILIRCRYRKA